MLLKRIRGVMFCKCSNFSGIVIYRTRVWLTKFVNPSRIQLYIGGGLCIGGNISYICNRKGNKSPCVYGMSENKTNIAAAARARFGEYLKGRNMRCTSERFTILDAVMEQSEHFSVETFGKLLEAGGFHVSVATLYNTFDLLCDAGLMRRHRLGLKSAEYERVTPGQNHIHLVCTGCGKISEVRNSSLADQAMNAGRHERFTPAYFTMYVYGLCPRCRRKRTAKN